MLKSLADARGWETFVVPDDVGGRFSVLSAVGLLPMAVAGIDVRRVIDAAIEELNALSLQSRRTRPGSMPPPGSTCTPRTTI